MRTVKIQIGNNASVSEIRLVIVHVIAIGTYVRRRS